MDGTDALARAKEERLTGDVIMGTDLADPLLSIPRRRLQCDALFFHFFRKHGHLSANEILRAITDGLAAFRQAASQTDDATMVVAKIL